MSGSYIALGDSMSIDDYAGQVGRGAASLLHRNADDDFPHWQGHDLSSRGRRLQCLARDGASVYNILQDQLPQITDAPAVVTISMGGNDLLAAYGMAGAAEAAIATVAATGAAVLGRLRTITTGNVPIIITTVYDPSDGAGAGTAQLPLWPEGPMFVALLNEQPSNLARRYDAGLADVHAHFHGHGAMLADPGQPEARPVNRDLWYCGVVNPTPGAPTRSTPAVVAHPPRLALAD
jgi:lysophospholipase L1-like esterase